MKASKCDLALARYLPLQNQLRWAVFQVSVKPKVWAKLETASTTYDQWVAAITGNLGAATADGFVLEDVSLQVFERQSKQVEQSKESEAVAQVQARVSEQLLGNKLLRGGIAGQNPPGENTDSRGDYCRVRKV